MRNINSSGHCRHHHHGASKNPNPSSRANHPAYEGAKFDASGHCVKHPHILMCRPKSPKTSSPKKNDKTTPATQYVIVRKTCHLCGEHGLRNERKFQKKSWAHGYHANKVVPRKDSPKGLVGMDIGVKASSGRGSRPTRGRKGARASPTFRSRSHDHTPPTSPESATSPSRDLKAKLVRRAAPPPVLPDSGKETRRIEGRRHRLQGVIPAGLPASSPRCSRGRSRSHPRRTKRNDATPSDDNSGGTITEKRGNGKQRAKSLPRNPITALAMLDHLRV